MMRIFCAMFVAAAADFSRDSEALLPSAFTVATLNGTDKRSVCPTEP